MKKGLLSMLAVAALGVAFLFSAVYATQKAPDTITMDSKVFKKHKRREGQKRELFIVFIGCLLGVLRASRHSVSGKQF